MGEKISETQTRRQHIKLFSFLWKRNMIDILLDNDQGKRDHIIKLNVGCYNMLQKIQKIIKEYCE